MPQPTQCGCLKFAFASSNSESGRQKLHARTSAFSTSIVRSLEAGPMRSMSGFLLSMLHTETRLLVTLCVADCTRHGPTLNGG